MREVPLESNPAAFQFAERLFNGDFDDEAILLTGVGIRLLARCSKHARPLGELQDALRRVTIVARGSKPIAVLREWQIPVTIAVPEPNTWHEILAAVDGRPEKRIAIQEYGRPSAELIGGLRARGAEVTSFPVYQWDLPEDTAPLREAVKRLVDRQFDVAIFTTSIQVNHLLRIAQEMKCEDAARSALTQMMIASVGPTTSETLKEFGITADFEPSHPKMGFLINEAAARTPRALFH